MERVVKNDLLNGYNLIYFGLVDSDERRLDTRDSSNLQVRLTGRSEDGKGGGRMIIHPYARYQSSKRLPSAGCSTGSGDRER